MLQLLMFKWSEELPSLARWWRRNSKDASNQTNATDFCSCNFPPIGLIYSHFCCLLVGIFITHSISCGYCWLCIDRETKLQVHLLYKYYSLLIPNVSMLHLMLSGLLDEELHICYKGKFQVSWTCWVLIRKVLCRTLKLEHYSWTTLLASSLWW